MMKLIHTGDWHLGKKLFKKERTLEHAFFLEWLLSYIKKENIDVLLMSGDIFDSATPPHSALKQFFDFIFELSKTKCESYFITGNHDSTYLMHAFSSILKNHKINLVTGLTDLKHHHFLIKDQIELKCLPYFRNHEIFNWNIPGETFKEKMNSFFEHKHFPEAKAEILLAHHLFGTAEAAGSEQVIALSGIDSFPLEDFKKFDYLALGHIHKRWKMNAGKTISCYPGSPLPLRFSENNQKSVELVLVGDQVISEQIPVPQFRNLITLKCEDTELEDKILAMDQYHGDLSPFVEIQVKMNEPKPGFVEKVTKLLKDKNFELVSFIPILSKTKSSRMSEMTLSQIHQKNLPELFDIFYETQYPGKTAPDEMKKAFMELLQNANP